MAKNNVISRTHGLKLSLVYCDTCLHNSLLDVPLENGESVTKNVSDEPCHVCDKEAS